MNVEWVSRLPASVRATAYFAAQRLVGSQIHAAWRELQAWTQFAPAELGRAVEERLSALLSSALDQSAYYRQLGLREPPSASAVELLRSFPVLTREKLRENFTELVVDGLRNEITSPASVSGKRYGWLVVKTGGSTGVPTTVVHDARYRDYGRATRLFSQQLCGFPLGTRYFRLWGSEADLLEQQEKLDRRLLRNLLGEIPMNAFRARETELAQHYRTLQSHPEIRHLMAYVDASVSLATYIEDQQLPRRGLRTIMACAGTVTKEWREILQRVFQADVFDKYGSRECADIACECAHHTGLHVYSPNVFVEVVDHHGAPCPPGQSGRILVTLLNNLSFPMIRYEIGDLGVPAEPGVCPCGLAFPRLANIQGRVDDMLTTEDGTLLSSVFVRHVVGVSLNRQLMREWQLEQTGRLNFVFRYIPLRAEGLEANLRQMRESFQTALGRQAVIEIQQVGEIPLSATGKIRWIINRHRNK